MQSTLSRRSLVHVGDVWFLWEATKEVPKRAVSIYRTNSAQLGLSLSVLMELDERLLRTVLSHFDQCETKLYCFQKGEPSQFD